MEWVNKIGKVIFKCLAILPLFFILANYFTILKSDQRTETIGWVFLIASVIYFAIALTLVIKNWGK